MAAISAQGLEHGAWAHRGATSGGARYREALEYVDALVGELLRALEELASGTGRP
jgi:hypothetical protein